MAELAGAGAACLPDAHRGAVVANLYGELSQESHTCGVFNFSQEPSQEIKELVCVLLLYT